MARKNQYRIQAGMRAVTLIESDGSLIGLRDTDKFISITITAKSLLCCYKSGVNKNFVFTRVKDWKTAIIDVVLNEFQTIICIEDGNLVTYRVGIVEKVRNGKKEYYLIEWQCWWAGVKDRKIDDGVKFPPLVEKLNVILNDYITNQKSKLKPRRKEVFPEAPKESNLAIVHWYNPESNQGAAMTSMGLCFFSEPTFKDHPCFLQGEKISFDFFMPHREKKGFVGTIMNCTNVRRPKNHRPQPVHEYKIMADNAVLMDIKNNLQAEN